MKYTWLKTGDHLADNLGVQLQKVVRQMNQNQFKTRYRYVQANQRFIKFIAHKFKLQKLANIGDKHLEKYTLELIGSGKSHKYIKTELSAIRFLHNSMNNTRNELMDSTKFNKRMKLNKTPDGRVDRAWSSEEISEAKVYFTEKGDILMSDIIKTIPLSGLRLDELCTLRMDATVKALKTGSLKLVNTKGGVPREIPISRELQEVFEEMIGKYDGGSYLFTPYNYEVNHEIHKFKKSIQNKLYYHRDRLQRQERQASGHNVQVDEKGALTAHGLRHKYARETYYNKRSSGKNVDTALAETASLLGHKRKTVTKIYLAGSEG